MTAFQVTKLSGEGSQLDEKTVQSLKARLRGDLILPSQPGYEDARTVWNGMIDRRPALVARCLGTADVIACVDFAREHGLLLSIKGGGHNISGLAVADGALLLDMSLMRGVWVDPERRVARAQAGCLLGDVDRETQLQGLAAVLGFVSATGIAGLTVGGGFGYLTRRFGWSVDKVRSMDVVTADGRLVRASARENPDLFWGLRGGGGNFGVVTGFEYDLVPLGPEVVGGPIAWRIEDAPAVLEQVRAFAERAPPELTCVLGVRVAPPAPWLPKEMHGKPIAFAICCHTGEPADGERLVAPLKGIGKPVGDAIVRRPYVQQQSLLDATQPKGRRYYWKSEYLPASRPEMVETLVKNAVPFPSPHAAAFFFHIAGANDDVPDDRVPMGNRDAKWVLNVAGSWERPDDDKTNIAWVRGCWGEMRKYSTGGTYVNFLTEEEGATRMQAAYSKENLARLAKVKAKWDATNLFRTNKNVAPAG